MRPLCQKDTSYSFSTAGSDYGDIITTLIFTSGLQTGDSQCFMISIYHSVVVEDTEFFFANLTTSDPAVIIPRGYDSTIITIYDDPEDSEFSSEYEMQ